MYTLSPEGGKLVWLVSKQFLFECIPLSFFVEFPALRLEGSREKSLMDEMSARVSIFVKAQHSSPVSDTVLALL